MQCLCGCGLDVPAQAEKQRGRPRMFYSEQCATRYRVRKYRYNHAEVACNGKSDFYFSGIEKFATAQVLVKESASGMMSQLLYRDNLIAACKNIPLVMDSGAFTKDLTRKDIDTYAKIISRLGKRCIWYSNADKIGDQEQSNLNYAYLLSLLPEHLHGRILWVYQVSAPLSYLHQALLQHRRIGIGGLVPLFEKPDKTLAYQKLRKVAAIIAKTDVLPHYFGLSSLEAIQELHTYHRAFTTDSTTWLVGGKYGALVASNGKQNSTSEKGYKLDTEWMLRQNIRVIREWMEPPLRRKVTEHGEQVSWLEAVCEIA